MSADAIGSAHAAGRYPEREPVAISALPANGTSRHYVRSVGSSSAREALARVGRSTNREKKPSGALRCQQAQENEGHRHNSLSAISQYVSPA